MDQDRRHADGGEGRDAVFVVLEDAVREATLEAVGDAVANTQTFVDDGGEVGEFLELLPFGRWVGRSDDGGELGLQFG